MLSVQGTTEGRIFLAGKDGCLYEVVYQAEDGWFYRKCRKINHSTSVMSYILPSFLSFSEQGKYVIVSMKTCICTYVRMYILFIVNTLIELHVYVHTYVHMYILTVYLSIHSDLCTVMPSCT